MKVWVSDDFSGRWPVGTAAVVVAEDEDAAKALLDNKLRAGGLHFDGTLRLISQETEGAFVLRDGDY